MDRTVGTDLEITAHGDSQVELQIAVARRPGLEVVETLSVLHGGRELEVLEVAAPYGGRLHAVSLPSGPTRIRYRAEVRGVAEVPAPEPADLTLFRRPSRYVQSDLLMGFAAAEFGDLRGVDLLSAVTSWVGVKLAYVPGSSGHTDGAAETLLARAGVCRDYAHVVAALLRALGTPTRIAAVYAPGCDPMDFHAVVEAYVADQWHVVDATALAPRSSMVRIATGRDAADTAFLATVSGNVELDSSSVFAVADDGLPVDDLTEFVALG